MKPTLVIIGRPNVGKSTLFNRLTRSRDALVADVPGLTRDRHYGDGRVGDKPYFVVDTGGLEPVAKEALLAEMAKQTQAALAEADAVIFVVDGREGLTPQDRRIAGSLRRLAAPIWLAVNKAEGMNEAVVTAEFHELGLGAPHAISAAHGEGVRELMAAILDSLAVTADAPAAAAVDRSVAADDSGPRSGTPDVPKVAVVGRPNVGKSTLVNALLGEERMIAFDQPGTTRDAIEVEFTRGDRRYCLVDTAGLRRKGRVFEAIEKFSVVKTMQAITGANVVILVLDARQEISDQDAHIAGYAIESGRALVVAVNKWEGLDDHARENVKRAIARRFEFLGYARVHHISAARGEGIGALMASVDEAYRAAMLKMPTPRLTRLLLQAVERQAPPRAGGGRPKLRYAHQGGSNPPIIVIHGSAVDAVPASYRRYLENVFRGAFALYGTPLVVRFRAGRNPYVPSRP